MRSLAPAATCIGAMLMLGGCGSDTLAQSATPESAPAPRVKVEVPHVVEISGSLTQPYALDSLVDFARSDLITNVVHGQIAATKSVVLGGEDDVYTMVTVEVQRSRNAVGNGDFTVRELGGIVKFEEVSDSYAAKLSEAERERRADEFVDYQFEHQPHSSAGQEVVLFVGGNEGEPGGPFVAARLVRDPEGGSCQVK